jgi:hypothetical protein
VPTPEAEAVHQRVARGEMHDSKGKAEPKPSLQIGSDLAHTGCPAIKPTGSKLDARTSTRGRIVLGSRSARQPGIKLLSKCIAVCKR